MDLIPPPRRHRSVVRRLAAAVVVHDLLRFIAPAGQRRATEPRIPVERRRGEGSREAVRDPPLEVVAGDVELREHGHCVQRVRHEPDERIPLDVQREESTEAVPDLRRDRAREVVPRKVETAQVAKAQHGLGEPAGEAIAGEVEKLEVRR